jgi:hypothetical protein
MAALFGFSSYHVAAMWPERWEKSLYCKLHRERFSKSMHKPLTEAVDVCENLYFSTANRRDNGGISRALSNDIVLEAPKIPSRALRREVPRPGHGHRACGRGRREKEAGVIKPWALLAALPPVAADLFCRRMLGNVGTRFRGDLEHVFLAYPTVAELFWVVLIFDLGMGQQELLFDESVRDYQSRGRWLHNVGLCCPFRMAAPVCPCDKQRKG